MGPAIKNELKSAHKRLDLLHDKQAQLKVKKAAAEAKLASARQAAQKVALAKDKAKKAADAAARKTKKNKDRDGL